MCQYVLRLVGGELTSMVACLGGHDTAGKDREGDGENYLKVEYQQTMAKHTKCGHRIYMVIRDLKLAVHLLVSSKPLHRYT